MRLALIGFAAATCMASEPAAQSTDRTPLGVTRDQLEDADLIDASGREIGEVEDLVLGPDGLVNSLFVEIDQRSPNPDRRVRIPLTGLTAVPDRDDPGTFDIQTRQTRDQLLTLPEAR